MKQILIANRGEIALRVIRTARSMGIATIAVYSEADSQAAHVAAADQAVLIGPAAARESYLDKAKIVAVARATGADAIHPGYGFLSENADFAQACIDAGLIFVGPPPAAIRAMGSKSAAKSLMEKAGVPLVPGYFGTDQSDDRLIFESRRVGFPLLIKASAGGGGKGMKIAETSSIFADALASAQREALSAFGDQTVLLEKYLTRPRHVELQIFADQHGNRVHLFDRDCSLQRRYQKVIEEAPAPFLDDGLRAAMAQAALAAVASVNYVGAGTVEFILENGQFYFMEMNTRLQVEHPVTEAITGLDLVEWQIRVAKGEALPLRQEQISATGHAIEARLYAEDPAHDFLPQTGRIAHLRWPADVRIESGVRAGDVVSRFYDPMLAKIIAGGQDRDQAILRLGQAIAATEIAGPATNRGFLQAILSHPAFAAGAIDTGFIPRHADALRPPAEDRTLLAVAAHAVVMKEAADVTLDPADPFSPWAALLGWRLSGSGAIRLQLGPHRLVARHEGRSVIIGFEDGPCAVRADGDLIEIDGRRFHASVIFLGGEVMVFALGREARFALADPNHTGATDRAIGKMIAPMPGQVTKLFVTLGQTVEKGAPLIVIEAMKMEHTILAPKAGRVASLPFAVGDIVGDRAELLVLEEI
jgi:3-methylcrotonyl-CoA carboxylase alpha subunit